MGRKKTENTMKRKASSKTLKRTGSKVTVANMDGLTYTRTVFAKIDWSESYVSLLLGLFVVVFAAIGFLVMAKERNIHVPHFSFSMTKASSTILQHVAKAKLATPQASNPTDSITGTTYTVQEGDDLYDIAQRAYGDGNKWVNLANVNNLSEPDILNPGQIIKIPR